MSEMMFHQWLGSEKQLSITVERGMAGKYAHKISYGGKVEERDDILTVLEEVDRKLAATFGSQQS